MVVTGAPLALRLDNGPEFIAPELLDWCEDNDVGLRQIQPGKPDQNAYTERFSLGRYTPHFGDKVTAGG